MTRTTRKTVCFIVIMLFVAGVITFFAFATSGFKNWNANTWFNSEPAKVSAPAKEEPSEPNDRGEEQEQENMPDENVSVSAFSVLTSAAATEPYTYDTLPEGACHINVGDDLSGKILVFDFPNFLKNKPYEFATFGFTPVTDSTYSSIASKNVYSTGAHLTTSGGYSVYLNSSSTDSNPHSCYLRNNSTSTSVMDFYTVKLVTFQSESSPSETSSKYEISRSVITGFKLPNNVGTVTEYPVKTRQMYSGGQMYDHHEYTNCYVLDPTTPLYTITNENPYPDKTFDDGAEIYPGGTYEGGYVVLNKSGISSFLSGTTQATLFGDTEHSIEFYRTDRILYLSDPEHSTMVQRRAIQTGSETGYVYIRMDLGNVCNVYSADLMSQSVRYLTEAEEPDNPSPYITVYTDKPSGLNNDFDGGVEFETGKKYSDGYLVVDVVAFKTFLGDASVGETDTFDLLQNYSSGVTYRVFVDSLCLKYYYLYDGETMSCTSSVLIGSDMNSGYIYVPVDFTGVFTVVENGFSMRYVTDATFDVDIHTVRGIVTYKVGQNKVFDYDKLSADEKAKLDYEHYTFDRICTLPDLTVEHQYTPVAITANTTLYAAYTAEKCKVMYYTAYGEEVRSVDISYDHSIAQLPTPERTGYTFKGWYYGDGTEYTGQKIRGTTVLNAKWELNTYSVVVMSDGTKLGETKAEYGSKVAAALAEIDLAGKNVDGWYTDANNEHELADNAIVSGDVVVFAKVSAATELPQTEVKPAASWWERNMWYVLGPCIAVVALVVLFFIGKAAIKRGK